MQSFNDDVVCDNSKIFSKNVDLLKTVNTNTVYNGFKFSPDEYWDISKRVYNKYYSPPYLPGPNFLNYKRHLCFVIMNYYFQKINIVFSNASQKRRVVVWKSNGKLNDSNPYYNIINAKVTNCQQVCSLYK